MNVCDTCTGWVDYSPDDLAYRCWNCGRLYYTFEPITIRVGPNSGRKAKAPNPGGVQKRSHAPKRLYDLVVAHHGYIHIRDIYSELHRLYRYRPRYIRALLTEHDKLRSVGNGYWILDLE